MATLTIGGRTITVDDKFLSLPPEEQQKTVDEIANSLGITPETAATPAAPAGPPLDPSFQPATLGTAPSLLSRKAMREPSWPEPQGAVAPPMPLSDMGPMSVGLGVDQSPFAQAFPQPARSFSTPVANQPAVTPDYPLTDAPAEGLVPDPGIASEATSRMGKILLQKGLSGLTNLATLPVTIPQLGLKGAEWGVEQVGDIADKYAVAPLMGRAPRTIEDLRDQGIAPEKGRLLPQVIKDTASNVAGQLGYQEATPETFGEKVFGNMLELGVEGGGTGAVLNRLAKGPMAALAQPGATAPSRITKFLTPYAEQPAKTIAGDVFASAGAGVGQTGTQYLPDEFRNAGGGTVGALADLMSMGLGGVAGGQLASTATGAPGLVNRALTKNRPAEGFTPDPITGEMVSNQLADEASRFVKSVMSQDPNVTAQEIAAAVKFYRDQGLPLPTTGLLPTGDSGLAALEQRQRTKSGTGPTLLDPNATPEIRQQHSFLERDQALRNAATEQIQSTLPPPKTATRTQTAEEAQEAFDTEFQRRAAERAAMQEQQAQRGVDQPTGQAAAVQRAREEPAAALRPVEGQEAPASRNIHDVYAQARVLERNQRDALYNDPAWTEAKVDATPVLRAARSVNMASSFINPVKDQLQPLLDRVFEQFQSGRILRGGDLTKFRNDVEDIIQNAGLKRGELFTELKKLKDSVNESIDALPANHPGKQAIDRADAHFRGITQPQFRQFAGEALDDSLKTKPGQVYPSATGGKFLDSGEDASQLMAIANRVGQGPFTAAQARTVLFDRAVQNGIIKDGVIDADALTRWRNRNSDVIQRIPNLDGEINTMIRAAETGEDLATRYATQIKSAEAKLTKTKADIAASPVSKIQDKTPEEAVATIMNGNNAPKNMAKLRKDMGNNPDADASLRAGISKYFADQVKTVDVFSDTGVGTSAAKLEKMFDKHRETLVAAGYTPDQMQALQRAQTVMRPLLRRNIQATTGSATAERTEAALRPLELALKGYYGILKGGGVFRTIKVGLKTLKGDPNVGIERLVTRMMFDPDLAQAVLTRDIKKAGTPAWNAELQKAIRRIEVGRELVAPDEKEDEEEPAAKTPITGR